MSPTITVAALHVYPVKSAGGVALSAAALTRDGLAWDRQWAVVKEGSGRFISQRDTPKLALIQPSLPADAYLGGWGSPPPDAALTLTAPGAPPLAVLLAPPTPRPTTRASVWEWDGDAHDEGDDAAAWLTGVLGKPVRLVRYAPDVAPRAVAPAWAAGVAPTAEAGFADGFPLLLVGEASVTAASEAAGRGPLDAARWRPNIVTRGAPPYAEDGWARLTLTAAAASPSTPAAATIALVKPCDRCTIPHVNPATGARDVDTTGALRRTRTGAALGWSALPAWGRAVFFGWNGVPVVEGGGERGAVIATVRVGDGVTVTATRAGAPGGGGA